jgi:hypothetical protein
MEGLPENAIIAEELKPNEVQPVEDSEGTAMNTNSSLDLSTVPNLRQLSSLSDGSSSAMTSTSRISGYFCHACQVRLRCCTIDM